MYRNEVLSNIVQQSYLRFMYYTHYFQTVYLTVGVNWDVFYLQYEVQIWNIAVSPVSAITDLGLDNRKITFCVVRKHNKLQTVETDSRIVIFCKCKMTIFEAVFRNNWHQYLQKNVFKYIRSLIRSNTIKYSFIYYIFSKIKRKEQNLT